MYNPGLNINIIQNIENILGLNMKCIIKQHYQEDNDYVMEKYSIKKKLFPSTFLNIVLLLYNHRNRQ